MKKRPRYNAKGYPICECVQCKTLNYCEPHGTTTHCKKCGETTEHVNVSYEDPRVDSYRIVY